MNTKKFFVIIISFFFTFSAAMTALAAEDEIPLAIPAELLGKKGAHVNKSTQTITVYSKQGKVLFEDICGTGALFAKINKRTGEVEQLDTPKSPKGKPFTIFKKNPAHVNADGVGMPFSLFFFNGCAIHGNHNFVSFKKRGIPQSGGCVRLPMDSAEKVYNLLDVGDPVVVTGIADDFMSTLGLDHLFNTETAGKQEDLKFLVDLPNPSKEEIAAARKAWLDGLILVEDPRDSRKRSEMWVRYPSMPETTRMNFLKFENIILTPQEKKEGRRLTVGEVELRD